MTFGIESLVQLFTSGGWIMVPLAGLAFLLWYAIGQRWLILRLGPKFHQTETYIKKVLYHNPNHQSPSQFDKVLLDCKEFIELNPGLKREDLDQFTFPVKSQFKAWSKPITTVVTVSPLLGLLGTVIGMIETFDSLSSMVLFAKSGGIAGGISQALLTTQMGLAVAIPGLLIGRWLTRIEKVHLHKLDQILDILYAQRTSAREPKI